MIHQLEPQASQAPPSHFILTGRENILINQVQASLPPTEFPFIARLLNPHHYRSIAAFCLPDSSNALAHVVSCFFRLSRLRLLPL